MTAHLETADPLLSRILGRCTSLFAEDMTARDGDLKEAIGGRRLMIAGGAGSIGGAFVKQVLRFRPAALFLVDPDENGLVDVVRDLRSSSITMPDDFQTYCIAMGSPEFGSLMRQQAPVNGFINFAALKHVRSERDAYSLLRMIDTNVRALHDALDIASDMNIARVFSVSSDKAVNPASLMGATKNLMEKLLWAYGETLHVSTARFANVAFSAGSLLDGFEKRLELKQPLAAPENIRRYFISHEEAGQLCLLAAFLGANGAIFVPNLAPDKHLQSFHGIVVEFLAHHGLTPLYCDTEDEAKSAAAGTNGKWPVHLAPSNTTGEKAIEEFFEEGAIPESNEFHAVSTLASDPVPRRALQDFLAEIEALRAQEPPSKPAIVEAIQRAVPDLVHVEQSRNLDQIM